MKWAGKKRPTKDHLLQRKCCLRSCSANGHHQEQPDARVSRTSWKRLISRCTAISTGLITRKHTRRNVNHEARCTTRKQFLLSLQDEICQQLSTIDGTEFVEDNWQREAGGGGRSRVLRNGGIFEQAGVNFSHVHGDAMPASATAHRPELAGRSFEAMGVSLVVHPQNPFTFRPAMPTYVFYRGETGRRPGVVVWRRL